MISPNRRRLGGLVVAIVLFSCSPGAQTTGSSFDELQRVPRLGQLVVVTNESGWETKGPVEQPATASAPAQGLRFGVKVGVPLTTDFETGQVAVRGGVLEYSSATRRYTLGPSAEWRLKPHIGLEFDALYKRIGYVRTENTSVSGVTIDSSFEVTGNSWDFPMMAKYRWDRRVAPYVASGFVLRYMGLGRARGVRTVQTAQTTITTPIDSEETVVMFVPGATVALGLEFGRTRMRLLPEFRYSRWQRINISGPLHLEANQIEFLLGFLF
jgi:outer membrane protein with beta-barrel domain